MLDPRFLSRPLAHRGLHNIADARPENSVAAFQAAIDAGYGIELDLQSTKDGQAVVFHDYDLQRLMGRTGAVQQKTLTQMQEIPLLGGEKGAPSLETVLELVDGQVPLLIEIKDQDLRLGPNVGPLEQATTDALENYQGPVAVMSFNPHSVAHMQRIAPQVARGLVTCDFMRDDWPLVPAQRRDDLVNIPDFEATKSCFISHQWDDLSAPAVRKIKESGHPILCWTIRSAEDEAQARKVADNVTFEGYLPA